VERAPAQSPLALPRLLLKILYPAPFPDLVVQQAREQGVDPLLLCALMKQESLFNPRATSSASAKGLTQVIPSTGQEIARNLGLPQFETDDLYRPVVSIRFGAFYLARQLAFLAGNPLFALAAYNGGPGNALRWMGNDRQADQDLFVETIDYEETALYVRVVMENYGYYRLLYRGD
jgi:soluble lytic murein transglycosylase